MGMNKKVLRVLFLGFILVALGFGLSKYSPQVKSQDSNSIASYKDQPEMKDILDPADQTKRLKAARKFVERVDVEAAMEILEHSPLPHTGEGHLVVHQIGFYAYQKYGAESILKCKDYFLYACYHGAFMENLFGVHDWGEGKELVRDWLKDDDPYFPCNYFGEKYQKGCWLNQAARIYQMNNGDLVKTTQICETTGNEQY